MTQTTPNTTTSDGTALLAHALDRYVRGVAKALDVPSDGISFEVTDTATAYVALGCRAVQHPDRDVMLVWSATQGWTVSIETDPAEPPIVLARSSGDLVPAPGEVARLVTESMTRLGTRQPPATIVQPMGWSDLAERMELRAP